MQSKPAGVAAAESALAEANREFARLQQKAKRARRRDGDRDLHSLALPRDALMVFVISQHDATMAAEFLQGRGGGKQLFSQRGLSELTAWVEEAGFSVSQFDNLIRGVAS